MNKIEHIGIAVKSIESASEVFSKLLGTPHYKTEYVGSEMVNTAFYAVGEQKLELLEATHTQSAIAKFIDKKGEGVHHIAFEVDDIYSEIKRLQAMDFALVNPNPKKGADGKLVVFLHPKTTNGVLIELCQKIKL